MIHLKHLWHLWSTQNLIFNIIFRHNFRHAIKSLSLCSLEIESTNFVQTQVCSVFLRNFCRLHVRNFQNKITCLLRVCYMHVFGYLRLKNGAILGYMKVISELNTKTFLGLLSTLFALQTFLRFLLLCTFKSGCLIHRQNCVTFHTILMNKLSSINSLSVTLKSEELVRTILYGGN